MELTVEIFDSLITMLESDRQLRRRFKDALFDFSIEEVLQDLRQTTQELRELNQRMEARMGRVEDDIVDLKADVKVLKADVKVLKADVKVLKADVKVLKADVKVLKSDVGTLKGKSYERDIRDKATGIFGNIVRRGRDVKNDVMDQLDDAEHITEDEFTQVLAADLLWGGKLRSNREKVVLVVEASWLGEVNDVERARKRADILQEAGIFALPVVCGSEWEETAYQLALANGVVIIEDARLNFDSLPEIARKA